MSLRLDTEGLRKRMVAVRSEGGRVEVDSGGTNDLRKKMSARSEGGGVEVDGGGMAVTKSGARTA
jgi:hypothetical protein